jgi:hypothetical protein
MEGTLKLFAGMFLVAVGMAYLYRPALVLRWNAWARSLFFNDAHLLHYRRKWGLALFLAGMMFVYSGFLNLSRERPAEPPPPPADLSSGYQAYNERRYQDAVRIAGEALRQSPGDAHADFLLRQARAAARRQSPSR